MKEEKNCLKECSCIDVDFNRWHDEVGKGWEMKEPYTSASLEKFQALHLLESLPACSSVKLNDLVQSHDFEERLRIHALR